jgi:hypothetical protein
VSKRRPRQLPDRPACWSWIPPESDCLTIGDLYDWQQSRCAICGILMEHPQLDHDHNTQLARGWLCPSCNTREAREDHPAIVGYRALPPAAIVGLITRARPSDLRKNISKRKRQAVRAKREGEARREAVSRAVARFLTEGQPLGPGGAHGPEGDSTGR